MQVFIRKPSVDLYPGVRVDKDTVLDYGSDHVQQHIENLVFRSVTKVIGEGYSSVYDTVIQLQEGDILIFEEEGRGYIKPVEEFLTIAEAVEELSNIKDLR